MPINPVWVGATGSMGRVEKQEKWFFQINKNWSDFSENAL
jgi:hypothetical protein